MLPTISDNVLALPVILLGLAFGYWKGRSQSLAWTQIPLIAFAISSIGPTILATIIYFGYLLGLMQPHEAGYRFSFDIYELAIWFAVMNWAFAPLYLVCRIWPHLRSARLAMWCSVIAMLLPNIPLFQMADLMVLAHFKGLQTIGFVLATLSAPIPLIIWPGLYPNVFGACFGIGFVISTLMAPVPNFRFDRLESRATHRMDRIQFF
jgi:hypothetical protein